MATQIRVAQLTGSFPSSSRSAATTVSAAVGGSGNNGNLGDALDHIASAVKRIHGASIFAGAAAGTFHTDIVPEADGTRDLGNASAEWAEVHANALKSAAALDIDAGGAVTIDGAGASNLSTSSGDLTLEAGGSSNKVVIKGDSSSGVAIHLDANEGSSSEIHMEAGVIDMDTGSLTLDATSTIGITGAGVDINAGSSTLELTSTGAVDVNSAAFTLDGSTISIDGTDSSNFSMAGNSSSEVKMTIAASNSGSAAGVIDMDADGAITVDAGAGLSLQGGAASDLTTGAGALTLDGAGGVSIAGNSSEVDITTTGALDLNGAAVTVDASSTLSLDAADSTNLTMTANASSDKTMSITASNSGSGDGLMVLTADTVTIAGNLDVNGTTTTIDTTSVAISDHNIVLDRDNSTSAVVDGCGLTMEGGSGDDITLNQASSADRLELKKGSSFHALAIGSFVANGTTIDIDGSTSVTLDTATLSLDGTDSTNLTMTANSSSAKTMTIAASNSGSSTGSIDLDADGTLDLDAAGGINIGKATDVAFDIDSAAMDIDCSGAYTLDVAGAGMSLDAAGASNFTTSAGAITIDAAAAALTLDGHTGVTVQSTGSGDVTLDSFADIVLDADGDNIVMKAGSDAAAGLDFSWNNSSSLWTISSLEANSSLLLAAKGSGSSAIEAMRIVGDGSSSVYARMASGIQMQFGGAGDYISGTGSALSVISGGDILLDPTGGDVNVDGNLMSQTDSSDHIGRGAAEHVAGSSASGLTSNLASGQSITMSTSQSQAVLYGSSLTAGSGSSAPSGITTSTLQTSSLSSFSSTPSGTLSFSGNGGASVAAGTIMSLQDSGGNKFFFVVVEAYSGSSSSSSMKIHALTNISGHTTSVSSFSTIQQHSSISGSSALSGVSASAGETVAFTDGSSNKFVFVLEADIDSGTPWGFIGDPRDDLSDGSSWSSSTSFASATAGGSVAASNCWASVNVDECFLQQVSEPSSSSDKLYNVGGTLYWSGAPIGTPAIYRHVMLSSEVSSGSYTVDSDDLTGDSDVTFTSSTAVNKVHVYLNGQLQYIASSGGDVALSSTTNQLVFGSGGLATDDIVQVIVYA